MSILSYEKKDHIGVLEVNKEAQDETLLSQELKDTVKAIENDLDVYVLLLLGDVRKELLAYVETLQIPVLAAVKEPLPENLPGCDIVIVSDTPEEEGLKTAMQIASNAPIAVQQIKRCVNVGLRSEPEIGRAYELQAFALCHSTMDKTIGMKALLNNENEKVFLRK